MIVKGETVARASVTRMLARLLRQVSWTRSDWLFCGKASQCICLDVQAWPVAPETARLSPSAIRQTPISQVRPRQGIYVQKYFHES